VLLLLLLLPSLGGGAGCRRRRGCRPANDRDKLTPTAAGEADARETLNPTGTQQQRQDDHDEGKY